MADKLNTQIKKYEGMKVAPSTRPSELLGKDQRFKSIGDVAADRATDENINAEWQRGMSDVRKGLKADTRGTGQGFEGGGAIKTKRGMKGIGGGRDMIAGAIGDALGDRLKKRYGEEAMRAAVPPPQRPEDLPVPMFKHGGKVGNAASYSKKFR